MADLSEPAAPAFRVSAGQAMEFRIWAELIEQSRGGLHVFLPLLDRGLDAVVHRMSDGKYIPLQVKSRAELHGTMIHIEIPSVMLVDEAAILIAGFYVDDQLGSELLVLDEATFKSLARNFESEGREYFWLDIELGAAPEAWRPYIVPTSGLAERLMGTAPSGMRSLGDLGAESVDRYRHWLGFVGEAEVIRQLSLNPHLDLFRPFPDIEFVEVLTRHSGSHRFCGLQVKTGSLEKSYWDAASVRIRKATFASSPTNFAVVLAWHPDAGCLADEALLIPTEGLADVAEDVGDHWVVKLHPHSRKPSRVDPYRLPLTELGARVEAIASGVVRA